MGQIVNQYLIDTNILITYLNGEAPQHVHEIIEKLIRTSFTVSVITKMELLGFRGYSDGEFLTANNFLSHAKVLSLIPGIVEKTIFLLRNYSIKLPDAIIAATALCHCLILVTHNFADFEKISGIQLMDPYKNSR